MGPPGPPINRQPGPPTNRQSRERKKKLGDILPAQIASMFSTDRIKDIPKLSWLFVRRTIRKPISILAKQLQSWIDLELSKQPKQLNLTIKVLPIGNGGKDGPKDNNKDDDKDGAEETSTEKPRKPKIVYTQTDFIGLCKNPKYLTIDSNLDGSEIIIFQGDTFYVMENLRYGSGVLVGSGVTKDLLPKINLKNLTSVVTIKEGELRGHIFAFYSNNMTSGWSPSGYITLKHLNTFKRQAIKDFPDNGFTAVYHNRDIKNPLLIGLNGKQVYYYKIVDKVFKRVKQTSSHKSDEQLPPDIKAAFTLPNGFVYMFRDNQYCVRELYTQSKENNDYCDLWLDIRLFLGCYGEYQPPYSMEDKVLQSSDKKDLELLCEDLNITGITKSLYGLHVYLFRGQNYWTIDDFPNNPVVSAMGLISDEWKGFDNASRSVFIVQEGNYLRGDLYSFDGQSYNQWGSDGEVKQKDQKFHKINAIFHNLDVLNPLAIGFADSAVHYIKTNGRGISLNKTVTLSERIGNWPGGITSAILINMENIYLFRGNTYCLRKWMCNNSETNCCKEWLSANQLFRC